jgi:hypothetical protein
MLSIFVRAELEHVLFRTQQNAEPFKVKKAETLVYIYTNSRLLHQVQTPYATMMTIASQRIPMMTVEHSWRRMTMTMMTTMAMEAKATIAAMEILLVEEENTIERTLQSFLEMFDWNGINEEIANGVDEHTTMGPIGNMHVNEDAPVRSIKRAYDRADEESNDDDYDEVANQYGTKNGNTHGHNGDGNDRGKDGATGTAVGGNNDAASVGSGDGGSYNVP